MTFIDDKRAKLLYILAYLWENTDEDHTVMNSEIREHFQNNFSISLDSRTIAADIKLLNDFGQTAGFEIEYDASAKGYKMIQRGFELDELQLLIDSVQSSKFITQRKAKILTDKLKQQASKYDRPTLDRRAYVVNRIRNMNDSALYGVDNIHAAIAEDKKINFRYFKYNVRKEKEYYKKNYSASPYALLWNGGNYYLIAYESGRVKHFRVDRMDKVTLAKDRRDGKEVFNALKISERTTKVFSMYGGKEEQIRLRFGNHLSGVVIDRFGSDIMMIPDGDEHFTVSISVEVSAQFYGWLCGLGKSVRVLAPAAVVDGMKKHIEGIASMYQENI